MKFEYSAAPQRSPEWFALRRGKVTASRLEDWMAVSKAEKTKGQPLKARLDYEKELMFERQFDVSYDHWVSSAMQDGIDFEDFARQQYEKITGNYCMEVGCWYNHVFCASPDREVVETGEDDHGLLEIKIVKDTTFTEILFSGVPQKHWKQVQGQLWASGKKWCDYVAVNFNTKKIVIIRVEADPEFFAWLELIVQEELVTEPFVLTNVHDIVGDIPDGIALGAFEADNNTPSKGDWSR